MIYTCISKFGMLMRKNSSIVIFISIVAKERLEMILSLVDQTKIKTPKSCGRLFQYRFICYLDKDLKYFICKLSSFISRIII